MMLMILSTGTGTQHVPSSPLSREHSLSSRNCIVAPIHCEGSLQVPSTPAAVLQSCGFSWKIFSDWVMLCHKIHHNDWWIELTMENAELTGVTSVSDTGHESEQWAQCWPLTMCWPSSSTPVLHHSLINRKYFVKPGKKYFVGQEKIFHLLSGSASVMQPFRDTPL